ncbi:MAG TPA: AMP-binding protein, partial [Verrucomicrobiota bacterium]|nr:AMP-binding protein [Verrucomicrobiota bacterium]
MLHERWLAVVRRAPGRPALHEAATGRTWTFAALADEAAERPERGGFVRPCGRGADFILATLRGWAAGAVICPAEETPAGALRGAALPPEVIHLKQTSGSTGAPRYVAFTAAQLAADADAIVATLGLRPDWPNLGAISLAHSYGFSSLVLPLLLHGIPLTLAESALPEAVRRTAATGPAWTLPAVPALWRAWREAGAIPPNVRLAISAGAPLPAALEAEVFRSTGLKVHNFYGSTECGGIAYDATPEPRTDGAVVGTPLRGVALQRAADGCLVVRGPAVGRGCWPEPDARLGDGCFRAAAFAELREGGEVRLLGRAADVINVAGRKAAPEAVEAALRELPGVRECVVFGVPETDAARGERVVACVAG